jgi:NADH-quinone oxidoreductase subunit N
MAAANDLLMLFVALETASISLYVMGGYATRSARSVEAGMKYFVYGAFASAVMAYGMSLLYGLTGQTGYGEVARGVLSAGADSIVVVLAAVLIIVGFGFKISVVPFHFWAPDVYEGAPTSVTGWLSTASKAAGFAVVLRVFNAGTLGVPEFGSPWWSVLVAICVVTMTLGNFLAIYQKNIKRLLAYSSIAQAGYVMIGVVSFSPDGSGAAMFYLLMYVVTNIAAFAVVILVSNATGSDQIEDLNGLSRRSPYLALAMLLALLSLGGIPPTAGFFGKFFVFKAAVDQGLWVLAFIGVLNAFVALYYYLSVGKYMYLYRSDEEDIAIPVPRAYQVALALTVFGVLYLGIYANGAFEWTRSAAALFFSG